MKTKKSILGVALTLMLLVSFVVAASPASAGTLSWSTEITPGPDDEVLEECDIVDLAVNGQNIYAAGGANILYRSTDRGETWWTVFTDNATDLVAVAPDNANWIAYADNSTGLVYVSDSAGDRWEALPAIDDGGVTMAGAGIWDLAVSAERTGKHYVAVAGVDTAGEANVFYFDVGAAEPAWTSTKALGNFNSTTVAAAVAFSPNYASDKVMVAVGATLNTAVYFEIFSFDSLAWNTGFTDYPVLLSEEAGIISLSSASISLAPTYLGSDYTTRYSFVGLTVAGDANAVATSGIYRLKDVTKQALKTQTNIHSVAYDGTNLVAGRYDDTAVYRSADPLASSPTVNTATVLKRPGGERKVIVSWAGTDVVTGTSGVESAFAVSRNNGKSFNDISLIDTSINNMNDVAVSANGSMVYMVTDNEFNLSVWRKALSWERVLRLPGTTGYIVRVAPEDSNTVYVAEKGAKTIYHSTDAGETLWETRTCKLEIQDIAVESAEVIYALRAADGYVSKSADAGFTWSSSKATMLASGHTIVSVGTDNLLVGSQNGYVAYSADGNTSWTKLGDDLDPQVQVTASGLADGDYIYAASSEADSEVERWQIGTSTKWKKLDAPISMGYGAYGIALQDSVLYVLTSNGTDSELLRTLNPDSDTVRWSSASTDKAYNSAPSALRVSTSEGVHKLWAIATSRASLYSFKDTLTTAGPTLVSPANGFQSPVNQVTGRAWDVAFVWEAPSLRVTAYDINICADAAGIIQVQRHYVETEKETPAVVIGPYQPGTQYVEYMPGATYYWRVRVSNDGPIRSPWSEMRSFRVQPLGPAPETSVSIDAPGWVPEGYDFTVPVNISNVVDFDACNYNVTYDPAVLMVDNVTDGEIDGTPIPVVAWSENVSGNLTVVQNIVSMPGISGSGHLAVIHFHALGAIGATSAIDLQDGVLSNNLAEEIPTTWVGDSVYISFFIMGDANGDGNVNAMDITKVERIIAGLD